MLFLALTLLLVFLHIPLWKTCSLVLGAGTADFGGEWATLCAKLFIDLVIVGMKEVLVC